ncbi:MAG: hypothetical protein KJ057_02770 [Phycisphaerae bacterium]|nr:MAG: hypothetical protein EDS66_01640 [Planctomycetota bacterium]KAB2944467.1 MAG: hypothetical protein F9K17_11305 [Phycisphaerae bacterium]MBE7457572.1 hypothetical protein [Planctomycetia bacterium]MCK6464611.1 hypothetical protein [Phycisphaerae bacterium]MCL4717374.1 hypothetical protein [Phycisphaerae bacterium]
MKVMIVLLVLIGAGVFAVYQFGGYSTLDPSQQGRDARAAIAPGMTWQVVVQTAGAPKEFAIYVETGKDAQTGTPLVKLGPRMKYNADSLESRVKNDQVPHGFVFPYRFSTEVAFQVEFDESGVVVGVDDMVTLNKLLDR